MRTSTIAFTCFLAIATAARAADDPLAAAKDLYAAAAYEDALTTLTKLSDAGGLAPNVVLQLEQYRSFCLIALGRTRDAESVAQAIIKKDPMFELSADESSPRVEAMFTQVRRQLLPGLIRERYRDAKGAVDRKELAAAETQFADLRKLITKAAQFGVKDEAIADLSVLVDGFLDLARAATAPKPAPVVEAPPPAPVAPKPAAPNPLEIFNASTADVTPPVIIRQRVPPVPTAIAKLAKRRGTFDLTIEADGRVSDVAVRESIQAAYDTMISDAAKNWRYKPATKGGVAVRYVKTIALDVQQD